MIYTDEWKAPNPKEYKHVLHSRVAEREDNQLQLWACAFKQNDPGEKILRNVSPTQVIVMIAEESDRYRGRQYVLKAYELDGFAGGRRKEVKINSSNSHGDLIMCDTYDECVHAYNYLVQKALDVSREALVHRTAQLNDRISTLEKCLVIGHVSEVVNPS